MAYINAFKWTPVNTPIAKPDKSYTLYLTALLIKTAGIVRTYKLSFLRNLLVKFKFTFEFIGSVSKFVSYTSCTYQYGYEDHCEKNDQPIEENGDNNGV